eukprot:Lithocolla_globosa_v1_NODE_2966_length_1810_cov_16.806838.p2 type:complete len:197 gc:universal NODE_2966_length_1810_cov_16.806838:791-1381(+)
MPERNILKNQSHVNCPKKKMAMGGPRSLLVGFFVLLSVTLLTLCVSSFSQNSQDFWLKPFSPTEKQIAVSNRAVESEEIVVYQPPLANATLREQLGRSSWHLLHTMVARYPEQPGGQQQEELKQFFHSFSRLYPCGQCAEHFQKLLQQKPPRVASREEAVLWLCEVHNVVNERLGKSIFDCRLAEKRWPCGCSEEI